MARKTFNEKLNGSKDLPQLEIITDPKSIARYGGERMFIAAPIQYDEIMKKIPKGKVITSDRIRSYLAKKNNADFTCPLTAGIFINIAAHASDERDNNKTPYWRTLKKDGELNEKYPGSIEGHKTLLETEGHTIVQKGKRYFMNDYEKKICPLK